MALRFSKIGQISDVCCPNWLNMPCLLSNRFGTFFVLWGNHGYVDMIVEKQLKNSMGAKILRPKMMSLHLDLAQIWWAYFVSIWYSSLLFIRGSNCHLKVLEESLYKKTFVLTNLWCRIVQCLYFAFSYTQTLIWGIQVSLQLKP